MLGQKVTLQGIRLPDFPLTTHSWVPVGAAPAAIHKEPTQAPSADSTQNQGSNMAATSPPFSLICQPMYVRPAHLALPEVDLLTK
jgi:hypothetical protein